MWREETETIVADLIASRWIDVAENQRFSLSTPSIIVPEIKSAALDTSTCGLRKAARVLLAVQRAVNVRFQSDVTNRLVEIAE